MSVKGLLVQTTRYTGLVATTFEPQRVSYPPHTQYVNNVKLLGVALPFKIEPNIVASVTLTYKGKRVTVPVVDVGPWNIRDDYWRRRAPPRVLSQFASKTPAENRQVPTNKAAIDLTWYTAIALGLNKETKVTLDEVIIEEHIRIDADVVPWT